MDYDNSVLSAIVCLERAQGNLNVCDRLEVSTDDLNDISNRLNTSLNMLRSADINDHLIITPLLAVIQFIEVLKNDSDDTGVDENMKIELYNRITDSLNRLYVKAGHYYESHDFFYTERSKGLLCRIVDRCIAAGYYFGVDKEIEEELHK